MHRWGGPRATSQCCSRDREGERPPDSSDRTIHVGIPLGSASFKLLKFLAVTHAKRFPNHPCFLIKCTPQLKKTPEPGSGVGGEKSQSGFCLRVSRKHRWEGVPDDDALPYLLRPLRFPWREWGRHQLFSACVPCHCAQHGVNL